MKFDYIIGNPPYQNPNEKTDASKKLYVKISNNMINFLKNNGEYAFVTPYNYVKPLKNGSLLKRLNKKVKFVSLDADNYFSVGINICYWIIQNKKQENETILEENSNIKKINLDLLYSEKYLQGFIIINKLKDLNTEKLFRINNEKEVKDGKYICYKNILKNNIVNIEKISQDYYKSKVCFQKSQSLEKGLYLKKDCDLGGLIPYITYENENEMNNIKSFLLSDIIINLDKCIRKINNSGFSSIYIYLPNINKENKYTDNEIKNLLNLSDKDIKYLRDFDG